MIAMGPAGFMQAPQAQTVKNKVRYVIRGRKQFRLTFDEYGVLDTVEQIFAVDAPKFLTSRNKDVQFFVRHADYIRDGMKVETLTAVNHGELFPA